MAQGGKAKIKTGGPVDPAKLKSYVERIERVEEAQREEAEAKRDIYTEVKSSGLNAKLVRQIVKERKAKERDEAEQAELETYRAALGMPGATYRSVAEQFGIPKSTLQRRVPKTKNGTAPDHDPETGECKESSADAASASATHNSHHIGHAEGAVAAPAALADDTVTQGTNPETALQAGAPGNGTGTLVRSQLAPAVADSACGSTEGRTQPAMRGADSSAVETGGATLAVSPQAGIKPGPQDLSPRVVESPLGPILTTAPPDEDDLEFPAHLDRRPKTPVAA